MSSCTGAVSLSRSVSSCELAAGDHHRHAVVAERARDEHAVAGLDLRRPELDARRHEADAGRGHVEAVGLAALDHLRVAGRDRDTRRAPAASRHRRRDPAQVGDREALPRRRSRPRAQSGRAPETARSLTVPLTASSPMSPPGKKSGLTTYESVVNASRASPSSTARRRRAGRAAGCRAPRGRAPRRGRASPCRPRRARA